MEVPALGMPLPPLDKGRLTASHVVRWCAAQENWDRIHYDRRYAREVAGLPDAVINGALKQQFLVQLATSAFGERSWLWRLACRFRSPALVGQRLRAEGRVRAVERQDRVTAVHLDLHLFNMDTASVTTDGTAVVLLPVDGIDAPDELPGKYRDAEPPSTAASNVDPDVPERIRQCIGSEIERLVSVSAVEAGRLRLFAEAVMDLPPWHHDPEAARTSIHGGLVAPPLFPIHAMSWRVGAHPLSTASDALGREAVCEVGREFSRRFGLPPQGLLNGGTRVRIHTLARPGDTVQARCLLRDVRYRVGSGGAPMLIFETENHYETTQGRLLLHEQQTTLQRLG